MCRLEECWGDGEGKKRRGVTMLFMLALFVYGTCPDRDFDRPRFVFTTTQPFIPSLQLGTIIGVI